MRPNIFDYATSELSQDAFLAWYCRWADETMTDDMELHTNARAFLKKYIAIQQPDYNEEIRTVKVEKQHKYIDVFLKINDNLSVIIEDKVNTGQHSNQLERYKEAIKGRKVMLYVKTGDESLKRQREVETKEYIVIDRASLLQDLEMCKSESEIFVSFIERLRKKEDETHAYRESNVWNDAQVIGFYKDMEQVLPKSNWGHVDNPDKGSYVLNWTWLQMSECWIYLEISILQKNIGKEDIMSYFKLLVKIEPDERSKGNMDIKTFQRILLHKHSRDFIVHANGLVHRPSVLRNGNHMTIAEVGFKQFAKGPASIDIHRIAEKLRPYEAAVRSYAEMQK